MAQTSKHLRSGTADKRPTTAIAEGQFALNTNASSPGLYFKDSAGTGIIKVGPCHVGTTAPNAAPAAGGSTGNSIGEQWLDTSGTNPVLKVWDGSAWQSQSGEYVNASGDTMTGVLVMDNQQQVRFRETTANGTNYIAIQAPESVDSNKTLTLPNATGTLVSTGDAGSVTNTMLAGSIANNKLSNSSITVNSSSTALGGSVTLYAGTTTLQTSSTNQGLTGISSIAMPGATSGAITVTPAATAGTTAITLPATTGTLVTTGDSGTVTSTMLANGTIVNEDVNASAAIAGTKISPDFGSQNVTTTGTSTAASYTPTSSTVPTNGIYLPAANSVGISTNSVQRISFDSSGNVNIDSNTFYVDAVNNRVGIGTGSPATALTVVTSGAGQIRHSDGTRAIAMGSDGSTTFIGSGADLSLRSNGLTSSDEKVRITTGGLVGIGTSTVNYRLTVDNNNQGVAGISLNANDQSNARIRISNSGTGGRNWEITGGLTGANNSHFTVYDQTASASRLVIDDLGRVAIGTTSPGQTLSVAGNIGLLGRGTSTGFAFTDWRIYNASSGNALVIDNYTTEALRVDSNNRLLVGTSSALSNVQIDGSNFTPTVQVQGTDAIQLSLTRTNAGPYMHLNRGSSGNNVSSDNALGLLYFNGFDGTNYVSGASIAAYADGTPGANDMPGRLVFSTTADGASSPTPRMTIGSNGAVLIGTTSTFGIGLTLSGPDASGVYSATSSTSSKNHYRFENPNGVVGAISTSGSATTYATSSDYRLKENVIAFTDGIARLQQLKPSRFNFIADPNKTVDGFIAHEVQAVVPEAITGEKDAVDDEGNPVYQGIDQSKLVPLLTAALQEAVARIEQLEAAVATLQGS